MKKKQAIQAKSLTTIQLKMLDIGVPVIVACRTLTGEIVHVRLQSKNLAPIQQDGAETDPNTDAVESIGSWETHGAYVAIMPNGVEYDG